MEKSAKAEQRMKIFFDVDGVLIDGWHADPARRKPWDLQLQQDFGISPDEFRAAFFLPEPGREAPMQACVRGAEELENALVRVLPRLGYEGPVEDFITYWFEKDSNIDQAVLDIAKQLASLPETELYIATGQEHRRAHHLWQTLGFEKHFEEMFYSARLGHPKPTPEFFAAINEVLGISQEERPLFFDDTETIVALAREAGWDAHLFETVEDLREHPRIKPLLERTRP
ncbi:HAD family hydrolase [Tepidicaulis sp. LMO-SS28]|uniref:HAD family hydrolase n=1 Tax=Tepidicaulis sp. LMO-SS28 TaxID=3447455 RepID=UPI003EDF69DE